MRHRIWRWLGLGAAVALMLVYFIELTSNGLRTMEGTHMNKLVEINNEKQQQWITLLEQQEAQLKEIDKTVTSSALTSPLEEDILKLEAQILELKKQALIQEKEQLEQLLLNEHVDQSNVNKIADSTSGVLQNVSSSGMKFVAELFQNMIN